MPQTNASHREAFAAMAILLEKGNSAATRSRGKTITRNRLCAPGDSRPADSHHALHFRRRRETEPPEAGT
jgi:hypothetical protein